MSDVDAYVPASVMVVVAHPDDAEFMTAGTIARWTCAGASATYVIVTKGDITQGFLWHFFTIR